MGAGGDKLTRRDALKLSSACLGTLVGTGTATATTIPPLETSYFVVTPAGDLRFALVYASEPNLSGASGDSLLSVSSETGPIELTSVDRIGWGESMVTEDSVSATSDRYDFADSTERTLSAAEDTTFNRSADDAKQVPELVERPETVVTGRITDAVSIPDFGDGSDTIEKIDLPEVRYVGGRTTDVFNIQKRNTCSYPTDSYTTSRSRTASAPGSESSRVSPSASRSRRYSTRRGECSSLRSATGRTSR